jgi:hypothetical protein
MERTSGEAKAMYNVVSDLEGDFQKRNEGPQPIGEILAELLAQYDARFPEARIVVAESPVAAA